ncbi:MAG: hypothetical protein CHKLHMKO_00603 [Candidatus Argoarchaeum ethanivorans]|uniref:CRISPR system Cms protein Csm4 n=1 Tax=Candidatus Argoarchaeum ethanivorans TaxID=2608793 RepID=A0A811TCE4_9EURY|nr:MAG: hypothetical protein CHKLHMKO_00603 [Candidatus Argoarchaeum ethanivorans]
MKTSLRIVKLHFAAPVHLGEMGIGLEENSLLLHSDTIFNAICNALSKLNGSKWVTDFLEKFSEKPCFRISSGFPFIDDTLLFPKPRNRANMNEELQQEYGKKLKKTSYLTKNYFERWIGGDELSRNDLKAITGCDISKHCKETLLPKVSVDRVQAESSIYFLGSIRFKENSGLWFIVDCNDGDYETMVLPALRLLQHDGIGGKRAWGYGSFELKDGRIDIKLPEADMHLLLSLYYPEDHEKRLFALQDSRWDFTLRGGYALPYGLKGSQQKPQMFFISEGSVFGEKPAGKLVEFDSHIEGLHKLYHYGIAYSIPISITRDDDEM